MSALMSTAVGVTSFFVFSVIWMGVILYHANQTKFAPGLVVMFSPTYWVCAIVVALTSVYLTRR